MPTANDVAAYILTQHGPMSTWKLQKLVYYAQAWSLVWDDAALFDDPIEAWANGPVVRSLYNQHRGMFSVSRLARGDSGALSPVQRDTVDAVLDSYGKLTGRQLSHLTHEEQPWRTARDGLAPDERSEEPISLEVMQGFYAALDVADEAVPVESLDWAKRS
ncbi:MAG TPA: type II toxin-antitoxin system antitoxin SocA domain-containing protein [Solirubrobacteraceae bacterium]|nr:type II toxin-antitoxin system antitoxin SocA domain-containing protein [Solirubrobacteraceae bacterium]